MKIGVFQHVESEGPGNIKHWAASRGHELSLVDFSQGHAIPHDFEALIVLGGPMSIYDEVDHPWLKHEKAFIKKFILANRKTVGICLGSQLVADALGAKIFSNKEKEIGFYPLIIEQEGTLFPAAREIMTFHWHGDTFELPPEAIVLAHSEATKIQVYQVRDNVLGLQCHFEIDAELAEAMISSGKEDLESGGKFIQSAEEIRAGLIRYEAEVKARLFDILDRFFEPV